MMAALHMPQITDPKGFGKVAVLMGGRSAEREISLESGAAVLAALQSKGVDVHGVDVSDNILMDLDADDFDRAFIILHGRGGEDGVMQGALETIGMPYTGSGVLGSALGMDKLRCKQLWQGAGMPTPAYQVVTEASKVDQVIDELGLPLIVKPSREGSSIGMTKVNDPSQLVHAIREAAAKDDSVIVERWISGAEYTVAVLGNEALPTIRLETPRDFYDFEAKYEANDTSYHCPCGLEPQQELELQRLAIAAFDLVGAGGWGRVDFMADEAGSPYLLEVNTVPGMTDHSLVPMAARAAGLSFEELVWRILETSLSDTSLGERTLGGQDR